VRRKLKNLRAKTGNPLTASRSILDLALYRERRAASPVHHAYDTGFSGWRNASRPRDQAISLRSRGPTA
jgi:hypothetical protein